MSGVFIIVVTDNHLLALYPKFRSYTVFNFNAFLPFFLGLYSVLTWFVCFLLVLVLSL